MRRHEAEKENVMIKRRLAGLALVVLAVLAVAALFSRRSRPELEMTRIKISGSAGAAAVAFSPDGSEIATGGRDKTVRRWNAKTGELIKTMEKHAAPVTAVAYSPDGADLLSGDADGKIRRWSLND